MENWFNVGKIVNTHGLLGEVRVISSTDFPEKRFKVGNTLYLFRETEKKPLPLIIRSHRNHKNFNLLTFENYYNVGQVEAFRNGVLKIKEAQLGKLDEGEFYFHEIIGCSVFTDEGVEIGEIIEVLTPGANDVWVIKKAGSKDILIPYIDQIVKEVDISAKKVIITPMEGLLD
ncbi:ribosome maturation factor RimM [Peribacillus butanolivorans]|uniref:ribosome maturation factor RimM n=1 Tax=Peribacillus TaxID=2675229 RepID=UPI0006A6C7CE|nr:MULTISPECIES: ribosome maturation factor RimM [Peribacillus]KON68466.1 16S rRNA processing protein RimM [Peribacillus butanolivorans]MBK5445885.1 ribosome maturation factor RimM [Peribacillus sp. TH24]MBK5459402.1 ribosome maturation factor RimM [Peribacillus sp. TH27]MBK5481208.1 ribosome maturation factor RimM [Peribacillus sp. TH16]MBK5497590.1 ribosome maturation factor RimM [Peribacillus sp. TH14]